MLAKMFKRPRCAIPITNCSTPFSAAASIKASKPGIIDSPPSNEKRFCPTYLVCKKFSKETITMLQKAASSYTQPDNIEVEAVLKFENHFFKPLRDTSHKVSSFSKENVSSSSLNVFQQVSISSSSESLPLPFTNLFFKLHRIMKVYKRLDEVEGSYSYVLFPGYV
jgi:hypothetical protein